MTNLIDDIKRDREAGTPGNWVVETYDAGDRSWWAGMPSVGADEEQDCSIVHWDGFVQKHWRSANGDNQIHANARRIARVPAMEDALIAAVEFVEDMQQVHDGFDLGEPHDHVGHYINKFMAALEAGQ